MNRPIKPAGTMCLALVLATGLFGAAEARNGALIPSLVLPLVMAELPAGENIVTAGEADLAQAVARAVSDQGEMAPAIVEAVLAAAPQSAPAVAAAAARAMPALAAEIAVAAANAAPESAVQIAAAV